MADEKHIEKVKKLFDVNDLSDINEKVKIGKGKQDIFGAQIIELFVKAKDVGITSLNVNQVTVAYYRQFVGKNGVKEKTTIQIMNKLFVMAKKGQLKKIESAQGLYCLNHDS